MVREGARLVTDDPHRLTLPRETYETVKSGISMLDTKMFNGPVRAGDWVLVKREDDGEEALLAVSAIAAVTKVGPDDA